MWQCYLLHVSSHGDVREVLGELISQVVEEHVTVVLGTGIEGELCLG